MKRQVSIGLQLLAFAVLAAGAAAVWLGQEHISKVFAAMSGNPAEQGPAGRSGRPPAPVVVARAGKRANDVAIEAIATARAKRFVTLYPEVSGEIMQLDLEAGERVVPGQVILELDSRDAELAVDVARVRVDEAKRALERSQQLLARRVNPQAKVDDARTLLERARLELHQAQEALGKRSLRAPFAGILGIPKVEVGDRVTPTTPIITVDDRSQLIVEVEVPEQYLAHVKPGQTINAKTPSFAGRTFQGTVTHIDSRVDPTSRTVKIRAAVPNDGDLLRPGMSFAIKLAIPGSEYPTVPELALQWRAGQSYVWRVVDGQARRVDVRTVRRLNNTILVEGDIGPGDLVVVEGVQRLRDGRPVTFAAPDAAPGS